MGSKSDKIARSPTPPETDDEADDGEEWPVHGIVGEDVDVFGVSRYDDIVNRSLTTTSHISSFSVMRQDFISVQIFSCLTDPTSIESNRIKKQKKRSAGKTGAVPTARTRPGCARSTTRRLSTAGPTR